MSPVRCMLIAALLLAFPAVSLAEGPIDSLVVLRSMTPRDQAAGLRLTPHAITVDAMGRPWVLDRARGRVFVLTGKDGSGRSLSVTEGRASGAFPYADISASGSYLFLLDPSSPGLTLLDLDGYVREQVDLASEMEIAGETGFSATRLLVGRSGDLWLIDPRGEVLHFDRRGRFLGAPLDALAGGERPKRIADAALAPDDGIVLLDGARPALVTLAGAGERRPVRPLGEKLVEPVALAVDGEGNGFILEGSGRIRVVDRNGLLLYDGQPVGETPPAQGRACITPDGILMRADPAAGTIQSWRIVRPARGNEER